jgi:hypothetical protein
MLRGVLVLALATPVLADTVFLYNGTAIDGVIQARHEASVELQIGEIGRIFIDLEVIESIEKNDRDGSEQSSSLSVAGKRQDVTSVAEANAPEADPEAVKDDEFAELGAKRYLRKEDVEDPELREDIEKGIQELTRQRRRHRIRAERQLLAIGEPAVPFLVEIANHENHLVRMAIMRILRKVGNEAAIPAAIDRLEDDNEFVRDYAVQALRELTSENFGFKATAGEGRRKRAVAAWRSWYEDEKAGTADELPAEYRKDEVPAADEDALAGEEEEGLAGAEAETEASAEP